METGFFFLSKEGGGTILEGQCSLSLLKILLQHGKQQLFSYENWIENTMKHKVKVMKKNIFFIGTIKIH